MREDERELRNQDEYATGKVIEELRAEVERLRSERTYVSQGGHWCARSEAAESRLATANALLDKIRAESESVKGVYQHPDQLEQRVFEAFERIATLLAGQPAVPTCGQGGEDYSAECELAEHRSAAPIRQGWDVEDLVGKPAPPRTEAEQRVLAVCASIRIVQDGDGQPWASYSELECVMRAELARRVLKP